LPWQKIRVIIGKLLIKRGRKLSTWFGAFGLLMGLPQNVFCEWNPPRSMEPAGFYV
jgi:hypothetical protein